MDANEIKTNFKQFTRSLDFASLLFNKVIPIIHDKILDTLESPTNRVDSKDLVKNFTNFITSINVMTIKAIAISYYRKKMKMGKDEYIVKKIDKMTNEYESFISNFETAYNIYNNLNKILDLRELAEIKDTLSKLMDNIQNKFYIVFQKTSEVIKSQILQESKKKTKEGKYEDILQNIHAELGTYGGIDKTLNEIIIGGKDVYIGGFKADEFIENKLTKYLLLENDLKDKQKLGDLANYYQNIFVPKANQIIDSYRESPEEHYYNVLEQSDIYHNLSNQINYVIEKFIPKLLDYYLMRSKANASYTSSIVDLNGKVFYEISFQSEHLKINQKVEFQAKNILNILKILIEVIKQIFQAINVIDNDRIISEVKKTFEQVDNVKSEADFNILLDEFHQNISSISNPEYSPFNRYKEKEKVHQKLKELIKEVDQSSIEKPNFDGQPNIKYNMQHTPENMNNELNHIKNIIDVEKTFLPILNKQEQYFDKITNMINDFIISVDQMLSPENTSTCIKKPAMYVRTILLGALLPKIAKRRLSSVSSNLDKGLNMNFMEKFDTKLYSKANGLNLEEMDQLIKKLCCPDI